MGLIRPGGGLQVSGGDPGLFAEKGMDVDIIKIEGSVELAPILS